MTDQAPAEVFTAKSLRLLESLEAKVEAWIINQFDSFDQGRGLVPAEASRVEALVLTQLAALFEQPALEQKKNPLQIIRESLITLNAMLAQIGVPAPDRDDHQKQLYPEDIHDFASVSFETFGQQVAEAGLEWGAAKAFVALNREGSA